MGFVGKILLVKGQALFRSCFGFFFFLWNAPVPVSLSGRERQRSLRARRLFWEALSIYPHWGKLCVPFSSSFTLWSRNLCSSVVVMEHPDIAVRGLRGPRGTQNLAHQVSLCLGRLFIWWQGVQDCQLPSVRSTQLKFPLTQLCLL